MRKKMDHIKYPHSVICEDLMKRNPYLFYIRDRSFLVNDYLFIIKLKTGINKQKFFVKIYVDQHLIM